MAVANYRTLMNGNTGASGGMDLGPIAYAPGQRVSMPQNDDINQAGAQSDPFAYTLGNLLQPFDRKFTAPTPAAPTSSGGGGGAKIPKAPTLDLGNFSYNWSAPAPFVASAPYQGAAPFTGSRLDAAPTFNGGRLAAAPEFRSGYAPVDIAMYRGPNGAFVAPDGSELARYESSPAYTGPGDLNDPNSEWAKAYRFRVDEGQRALENSAAARGTLRGGATLQALAQYGQDMASQEYAAADARGFRNWQAAGDERARAYGFDTDRANTVYARGASERDRETAEAQSAYDRYVQANEIGYGRSASEYDRREANRQAIDQANYTRGFDEARYNEANRQAINEANYGRDFSEYDLNERNRQGIYQMNYGNSLDAWRANADTSLGAGALGYQIASGVYDRNRENALTRYQIADAERARAMAAANAGAGNAAADEARAYNRAWNEFNLEREMFNENQDRQFNRLATLASLGQGSAGAVGNYGGQYAGYGGQYITGAGNAGAAGIVGGANAAGQAVGNIGNTIGALAMYGAQPRGNAGPGTSNPYYLT